VSAAGIRSTVFGLGVLVTGCTPPQFPVPGPTLPWWLVAAIMGGLVIYTAIRSRK